MVLMTDISVEWRPIFLKKKGMLKYIPRCLVMSIFDTKYDSSTETLSNDE